MGVNEELNVNIISNKTNPKTDNMGQGLTFYNTLEGPLTSGITQLKIQKVNRVFGGTIGPSTGEGSML